ncbi:MAG: hypothetical protein H6625_14095 [Bdellovibrionaceae bacterium]|nr:hypothetical protein [Pseudobdellovibrionaceae bacterium]
MEIENSKETNMGLKKEAESFIGAEMITALTGRLRISETLLAGLLDITSRTLDDWKKSDFANGYAKKSKRLNALMKFVDIATSSGVRDSELLTLLNEPINEENEDSLSPLYFIVHEPESPAFKELQTLVINRYLKQ